MSVNPAKDHAKKPVFKGKMRRFSKDSDKKNFSFKKDGPFRHKTSRRPFNQDSRPLPINPQREGFSPFQIRLIQSILTEVLVEKRPLDKAYAVYFSKVKLPSVEQGFILRHVNGMFRRLSYYAYVSGLRRPSDFERHVNRLIVSYCAELKWPLPDLDLGGGFDKSQLSRRLGQASNNTLMVEGCPIWLEETLSRELGDLWPAERKALGTDPKRFIRVNTLKTTRDDLASLLAGECVVSRSVKGVPTALEITSNTALFRTKSFKDGLFEQQDAASQQIAPFLEVQPGMTVIDACAGSGGKTLHLAALMENKGKLLALDTDAYKLEDLKKRARRAGVCNIETRVIDSTKIIKRLYDRADRVLIDAPCSGTGILRRLPDSKWRDVREKLPSLLFLQQDILKRYANMVKVGGLLVYSTCSIMPRENRAQIDRFLEQCDGAFELVEDQSLMPSSGFDGFYMAKLKRLK